MAKNKYIKRSKTNVASEPIAGFKKNDGNKSLQFFSSFEEMNNADAAEMAQSTSEQRLKNITYLISNMYKEELKKPFNMKLKFD